MRTGKELKEWSRRVLYLAVGLPVSVVATTIRATLEAIGGVWGLAAGALAVLVVLPVLALVFLILVPVMLLVLLAVGAAVAAALLGWPLRAKPERRYLRWEHWDEEE